VDPFADAWPVVEGWLIAEWTASSSVAGKTTFILAGWTGR